MTQRYAIVPIKWSTFDVMVISSGDFSSHGECIPVVECKLTSDQIESMVDAYEDAIQSFSCKKTAMRHAAKTIGIEVREYE